MGDSPITPIFFRRNKECLRMFHKKAQQFDRLTLSNGQIVALSCDLLGLKARLLKASIVY